MLRRTRTHRRTLAVALLAAVALGASAGQAAAETVQIPVPKKLLADSINAVVKNLAVTLDGYGSRHTSGRYLSWHEENAGSVTLAGVGTRSFTAPELDRKTTKTRRLRAYVNDLRTTTVAATSVGGAIQLTAGFESGGDEVVIRCLRYRLLKKDWKDECVIPSLAGKGLQIDDAFLSARLVPVARDGSISFAPGPEVDFTADIEAGGLCGALDGLCDRFTGYKGTIRDEVRKAAKNVIDTAALRDRVADGVRDSLEAAGILRDGWRVTEVADGGGSFLVTVERPDQIDAGSVKILGFQPLTQSVTATCPVAVGFEATVWSKYALSGYAWLESEDGSQTASFPWQLGAGKTATSQIARQFAGQAGQAYPIRWSRLIVWWQDQDGKAYSATSQNATYGVTCLEGAEPGFTS